MTRRTRTLLCLLLLVVPLFARSSFAAPSRASSRMRALSGTMEVLVRADAEPAILDSIEIAAFRLGYETIVRDRKKLRLRLEKATTLAELKMLSLDSADRGSKRLDFEVVNAGKPADRLRVIGAITLVRPVRIRGVRGARSVEQSLGKQQPYRDELASLLDGIRASFAP
jgi:hypothetical protein